MKTIVAGPWLGEFGWELMMWQARLRYLQEINNYDNMVCVIRSGHEFIYDDFADSFVFLNTAGTKNGYRFNEVVPRMPAEVVSDLKSKYGELEIISPGEFPYKDQKFIKFVVPSLPDDTKYDIVFHCRSTGNLNTDYRNWEINKWESLVSHFRSLKIACVGSKSESSYIEGTDDLRGISLENLVRVLSSNTKVIVGPSSGTMHLSSLCGCTHVVFTDRNITCCENQSNRYRYEQGWNPLKTKAIVIDAEGWRPSVGTVIKTLEATLS